MSGCYLSQTWSQKETDTLVCVSCLLRGEYIFFSWLKKRASGCVGLPLPGRDGTGRDGNRFVEIGARGTGTGTRVLVWRASTDLNGGGSTRPFFPSLFLLSSLQSGPARFFVLRRRRTDNTHTHTHTHTDRQRLWAGDEPVFTWTALIVAWNIPSCPGPSVRQEVSVSKRLLFLTTSTVFAHEFVSRRDICLFTSVHSEQGSHVSFVYHNKWHLFKKNEDIVPVTRPLPPQFSGYRV